MDFTYLLTPFAAWFFAGTLKFFINSIKVKRLALDLIGYGGLPSNHSAIVGSMATLIALKEGIANPAFGVAVTLVFIVTLDANSLRREVGKHAFYLNKISDFSNQTKLRERMGHSVIEIFSGIVVGALVAILVNYSYQVIYMD